MHEFETMIAVQDNLPYITLFFKHITFCGSTYSTSLDSLCDSDLWFLYLLWEQLVTEMLTSCGSRKDGAIKFNYVSFTSFSATDDRIMIKRCSFTPICVTSEIRTRTPCK